MKQEKKEVTAAIREFLWHCRFEKKLDEKTIRAYRADLRQMAEIVGETTDIYNVKNRHQRLSPNDRPFQAQDNQAENRDFALDAQLFGMRVRELYQSNAQDANKDERTA